jgi:glycosyltransferase involved in cell wall biosynthesis
MASMKLAVEAARAPIESMNWIGGVESRRVLFVAYHFPPDAAVGGTRPAKMARYLSQLGWDVHVVTVREDRISRKDHSRLGDVEGLTVHRTVVWPTVLEVGLRIRNTLLAALNRGNRAAIPGRAEVGPEVTGSGRRFSGTLKRWLNSVFELPDKEVGWLVPGVVAAWRVIRKEKIGVVVTSSPPGTVGLMGLVLAVLTRVRLITDLRDPWFFPTPDDPRSLMSDAIQRWMERRIMHRSAHVITTTDRYRALLRERYGEIPDDRFSTILNGYDEEDFRVATSTKRRGVFTMSYLGSFYFSRTPRELLIALARLVAEGTLRRSDIEVRFIGAVRHAEGESVTELAASNGLADCVTIRDSVGRTEALSEMMAADVLLLFAPDQPYCIPAKTFEYIRAGGRILCLAGPGATADLMKESGAGLVLDPTDIEGITTAIRELYREFKQGRGPSPNESQARYDRQGLARRFSDVVEDVLTGAAPTR